MTKIYISGGPGSGKTTYAKFLSEQLGGSCFDLDEIKWINRKDVINKARPKEERLALLDKILSENKNWIIEGVYFQDWILPIIEQADTIIVIWPSFWLRQYRIIRRSFRRMFGFEPKKHKETLKGLWQFLCWSRSYENKYLPLLLDKVKKSGKACKIITKIDKI